MNVTVIGTGYVGLVTGTCLAEVGNHVTCIDIDAEKVSRLNKGSSPIYEPGIEGLIQKNLKEKRLNFSISYEEACSDADVIIMAVGTPSRVDGSANLSYIQAAAESIGQNLEKSGTIIVTKSTVPVGTNRKVKAWVHSKLKGTYEFHIASVPEFLREGSAIHDTFNSDRIIIGSESEYARDRLGQLFDSFKAPIVHTSIESAEMIKYASNAFLATKISFINEIANLCEKLEANVEEVAYGMGLDKRIGSQFLGAGIGYGGSCFPKDTNALVQIAGDIDHHFELLESVIRVNAMQQKRLVEMARTHFSALTGKKATILGLAFKPNTDDIREAAAIEIIKELLVEGVSITVYDPVAIDHVRELFGNQIEYCTDRIQAVKDADMMFLVTEWDDIKSIPLQTYRSAMKQPIIFDGRNCYNLEEAEQSQVIYYSIGRPVVQPKTEIHQ